MGAAAVLMTLSFAPALGLPPGALQQRDRSATAVGTGSVSGRAYIVENGEPVPVRRARVRLDALDRTTTETTDTDVNGFYRFERLPAGSFRVTVEKAGFVPRRSPGRTFAPAEPIDLAAAASVTADVEMLRASAIEGRILGADGRPVTDVIVSAMRSVYARDGRRLVAVSEGNTDDLGRFRIHTLPAGEYRVEARPDQRARLSGRQVPGEQPRGLARIYYPGTPFGHAAQAVMLTAGQDLGGLDFVVTEVPVIEIAGTVASASGRKPEGFSVRMRSVGDMTYGITGLMLPSGNGFRFPNVPPGEYWLTVVAVASQGAEPEYVATRVNVEGGDVPELALTTAPGAVVNGTVATDSGAPLPVGLGIVAEETVFELPLSGTLPKTIADLSTSQVSTDGRFTFPSLFGPRRIRVDHLPAGWALSSVRLDGRDVTDEPVDFSHRQVPASVELIITSHTATVSGQLRLEDRQPARHARVVVFSQDRARWGPASRFVSSVEADAEGRFEIRGILPGAYRLAAVAYLDDGAWMDADVLGRLWSGATPASLAAGQVHEVTLQVR